MKKIWLLKVLGICLCVCVSIFLFTTHSNGQLSYYPYGYQQSYNDNLSFFAKNPYGYQQSYNPYGYQSSYYPGYQQSYNPYGYQQQSYNYGWDQPSYGWDNYNYMYPSNYNPYSYTLNQSYGWMPPSRGEIWYPQYSFSSSYSGGYPSSQGLYPYLNSFNLWPSMEGGTKTPGNSPPLVQGTSITGRVVGPHTIDSNGKIITCYVNAMFQAAIGQLDLSPYLGMVVEVYGDLQMDNNSQGTLYGARFERVLS